MHFRFALFAMPVRARFLFAKEVSPTNAKSSVLNVKHIQIEGEDVVYGFPANLQDSSHHELLMKTRIAEMVKAALTRRHERANPIFSLDETLQAAYLDEEGNAVFKNQLLKEVDLSNPLSQDRALQLGTKPLSTMLKDAVLEKFHHKSSNANVWIESFISECRRLEIPENRFYEALRLFLEDSAADWYKGTNLLLQSESWQLWQKAFLEAFAPRGWSLSNTAFSYRWLAGSLSDYALRKFNLLASYNPKMDESTRIALIVHGLPLSVQEKIEPNEVDSTGMLFTKINALERSPRTFPSRNSSASETSNALPSNNIPSVIRSPAFNSYNSRKKEACPYCNKRGFPNCFHPENECRRKLFDNLKSPPSQSNVNYAKPVESKKNKFIRNRRSFSRNEQKKNL